ncbi:MAG: hypothetical protein ACHP84_04160 [Caulobacterales bacterium]
MSSPSGDVIDGAQQAAALRTRARTVARTADAMAARASAMPSGAPREMLEAQARIMRDGARRLEAEALAVDPPRGRA